MLLKSSLLAHALVVFSKAEHPRPDSTGEPKADRSAVPERPSTGSQSAKSGMYTRGTEELG